MSLESIPIPVLFAGTVLVVMISIEAGHRMGVMARRRSEDEKESPVSGVAGAILGLAAFILAFTFGIVSERYDARKELVREEANAVRTAYQRSDFLSASDRGEARRLLREYVDLRLAVAQVDDADHWSEFLSETARIQDRLWDLAVTNARKDMNSDVAALFIESLNQVIETHALRMAVAVQARVPAGIWMVLFGLTILGMMAMGYHAGIAGSKRSGATLILAVSFAIVIVVIASLDRPRGFIRVTQQPLMDVQASISAGETVQEDGAPD